MTQPSVQQGAQHDETHVECAQMRMYRLGWLFEQLEINLSINLLWTTLFRNVLVRAPLHGV